MSPVHSDEEGRRRLTTARWVGTVAAIVLAVVTCGQPIPSPVVVTVGLVAMVTVVASWLMLATVARLAPPRRLGAVAVWWSLPLALGRPLFSGDLWSYLAQGQVAASGLDPYQVGPASGLGPDSALAQHVSHYWADTPAPYGPAWEGLASLVARASGTNVVAGVMMYRLLALAGILLIAWALPRLVRRTGVSESLALWLCLLNPLVLWHLVSGAHNDAVMLGLMLTGFELGLGGLAVRAPYGMVRFAAGFALVTVAANVKVVAAGAACCLVACAARRYGRPVVVTAVMAAFAALLTTALAVGTGLGFGWVSAMGASTGVYSWMAPTNELGLAIGGLATLFGWHIAAQSVHVCMLLGVAVGAVLGLRVIRSVYRRTVEPLRGLALLLAIVVACGPVVQPWYLLWAILPLAMSATLVRQRNRLVALSAVAAFALPPTDTDPTTLVLGYLCAAVLVTAAWGSLLVARRVRAAGDSEGRWWRPLFRRIGRPSSTA